MLKLRCFTISLTILAHFDFDGSNTSQKSCSRVTKDWKSNWPKIKTNGGVFDNQPG